MGDPNAKQQIEKIVNDSAWDIATQSCAHSGNCTLIEIILHWQSCGSPRRLLSVNGMKLFWTAVTSGIAPTQIDAAVQATAVLTVVIEKMRNDPPSLLAAETLQVLDAVLVEELRDTVNALELADSADRTSCDDPIYTAEHELECRIHDILKEAHVVIDPVANYVLLSFRGAICGGDSSRSIEYCHIHLIEDEDWLSDNDDCIAFVGLMGTQPADYMTIIDENNTIVIGRDGGKNDVDGVANGKIQIKGMIAGNYRFRIEGDDAYLTAPWRISMEECSETTELDRKAGRNWLEHLLSEYWWAFVAVAGLLLIVGISGAIWRFKEKTPRRYADYSDDESQQLSSSWPMNPVFDGYDGEGWSRHLE